MANIEQLAQSISQLTLLDAVALGEALEKLGIKAAAPVAVAGPAAAAAPAAAEQTEFSIELTSVEKKMDVIKALQDILPDQGLVQRKALVDAAPKVIKEGVSKAEAEDIKKKLEAAGSKVTLK